MHTTCVVIEVPDVHTMEHRRPLLSVMQRRSQHTAAPLSVQAKTAAKKAVKQVKKATPSVGGGARKTVRSRAGWWGDVRPLAETRECTPHAQLL